MAWDDIQIATDSITHTEWNNMVSNVSYNVEPTIDITNATISVVTAQVDHDALKNFTATEHFTKADLQDDNIIWSGTHQFNSTATFNSTVSFTSTTTFNGCTFNLKTRTANYTLAAEDDTILCNGTITITAPAASAYVGKVYTIKNIAANTVTISGGGNIDGDATAYLYSQYESISIVSDGSNWFLI